MDRYLKPMSVECWDGHDVLNVVMIIASRVRRGPRVQGEYEILGLDQFMAGLARARKAADG